MNSHNFELVVLSIHACTNEMNETNKATEDSKLFFSIGIVTGFKIPGVVFFSTR